MDELHETKQGGLLYIYLLPLLDGSTLVVHFDKSLLRIHIAFGMSREWESPKRRVVHLPSPIGALGRPGELASSLLEFL